MAAMTSRANHRYIAYGYEATVVNDQKVLVGKFSLGLEHPRSLFIERIFGPSFFEGNCAENIRFNLFRKEISAQFLVNRRQIKNTR